MPYQVLSRLQQQASKITYALGALRASIQYAYILPAAIGFFT
jgi:hypothetical protein